MRRIAVNKALDEIRKKKKIWTVEYTESEINEIPDFLENEEEDLIDKLHSAIKKLPDGCREILSLYLFEGFKHAEIAKKLGITESTSKSQYSRAKKLLASTFLKTEN